MKIRFQFYILAWSFVLIFLCFIALIWQTVNLVKLLKVQDNWTFHSTQVQKASNDAKTAFLDAETKGRYASFDAYARAEFPKLSKAAVDKLGKLSDLIGDNTVQQENHRAIVEAVQSRFAAQERTINAAVVSDGTIKSNQNLVIQGINTQSEALTAFTIFEAEENRLLVERYGAFWATLWTVAKTFTVTLLLSLVFNFFNGGWTWRVLGKASRAMSEAGSIQVYQDTKEENEDLKARVAHLNRTLENVGKILDS